MKPRRLPPGLLGSVDSSSFWKKLIEPQKLNLAGACCVAMYRVTMISPFTLAAHAHVGSPYMYNNWLHPVAI